MVKIYKLTRGYEVYRWLCETCVAKEEAVGWEVKGRRAPPHPLRCDGCGQDDAAQTSAAVAL